jgi:hypothetical protein
MVEIIVIGPEPPCIRCKTALKRAQEVAKAYSGEVEAKMLFTHEEELKKYGKIEGGHVIAQKENVIHNHERIEELRKQVEVPGGQIIDPRLVETVMEEIEKELTPVKEKAQERGYLMTPVVVINGKIKSAGYVPKKEEIEDWVKNELEKN